MIRPGEIYWADFEAFDRHRVVIISREELNRGDYVVAVIVTSKRFLLRSTLANCVPFRAGSFGFGSDCVAQCETVLTLEKSQLDMATGLLATLDESAKRDIVKAIGYVIECDCEPI